MRARHGALGGGYIAYRSRHGRPHVTGSYSSVYVGLSANHELMAPSSSAFSLSSVFETEAPARCDGGTSTPGSRDPAVMCVFARGAFLLLFPS